MNNIRDTLVDFYESVKQSRNRFSNSLISFFGRHFALRVARPSIGAGGTYFRALTIGMIDTDWADLQKYGTPDVAQVLSQEVPNSGIPYTLHPPVCPAIDPRLLSDICLPCPSAKTVRVEIPPRVVCPVLAIAGHSASDIFRFAICVFCLLFCIFQFKASLHPRLRVSPKAKAIFHYKDRRERDRQAPQARRLLFDSILSDGFEIPFSPNVSNNLLFTSSHAEVALATSHGHETLNGRNAMEEPREGTYACRTAPTEEIPSGSNGIAESAPSGQRLVESTEATEFQRILSYLHRVASELSALSDELDIDVSISASPTPPIPHSPFHEGDTIPSTVPRISPESPQVILKSDTLGNREGIPEGKELEMATSISNLEEGISSDSHDCAEVYQKAVGLSPIPEVNWPSAHSTVLPSLSSTTVCASSSDDTMRCHWISPSSSADNHNEDDATYLHKYVDPTTMVSTIKNIQGEQAIKFSEEVSLISLQEQEEINASVQTGPVSAYTMDISTLETTCFTEFFVTEEASETDALVTRKHVHFADDAGNIVIDEAQTLALDDVHVDYSYALHEFTQDQGDRGIERTASFISMAVDLDVAQVIETETRVGDVKSPTWTPTIPRRFKSCEACETPT